MENLEKWICTMKGCLMRDQTYFKEYRRQRRFAAILEQWKEEKRECAYCDKVLQTIHHKDENQGNNRLKNLIPVCREHHLEMKHLSDVDLKFQYHTPKPPVKRTKSPLRAIEQKEKFRDIDQNCSTTHFYDITLYNPITCLKIRISQCKKRTMVLMANLGYKLVAC